MCSGIYLGNFTTQNGRNTLGTGLASGIDSEALINSILAAKDFSVSKKEDKIEINNTKISELDKLDLLLERLQKTSGFLRNPPGINNSDSNLFTYTKASIFSEKEDSNLKAFTATSLPGAEIGTNVISNIKIAKENIISKNFSTISESVVGSKNKKNNFYINNKENITGNILDNNHPILFENDIAKEATKSSVTITFAADDLNNIKSLNIGSKTLTFGATGGDDLSLSGTTLEDNLHTITNYMNQNSYDTEGINYKYEVTNKNTIVITRNQAGSNNSLGVSDLAINYEFKSGDNNNSILINRISGSDSEAVPDELTIATNTLEGKITNITAEFITDSNSLEENKIVLKANIGGESYTSKEIVLSKEISESDNNLPNNILASGTLITFIKDTPSGNTEEQKDILVQIKTGTTQTINNQTDADNFVNEISNYLSDNQISISQNTNNILQAGSFKLGGVEITLKEGENLKVIASKINSVASESGIRASIIKASDDNYVLQLRSSKTGVDNAIAEYEQLSNKIKFGNEYEKFIETQQACDAYFDINGISVTRPENTISDVLKNVVFTLGTDMEDSITLKIENDDESIKESINDFINAYNEILLFISKQKQKGSDNKPLETSILIDENILDEVNRNITMKSKEILTKDLGGFTSLSAIGIETIEYPGDSENPKTSNILIVNEEKLNATLKNDFNKIKETLGFFFSSNSTELSLFKSSNNISLTNLQFDIDLSREKGDEVRVLDSNGKFMFNAEYDKKLKSIKGIDKTPIQGLELVYSGNGKEIIQAKISQGIADRMFNIIDNIKNRTTGSFSINKEKILNENIKLKNQKDLEEVNIAKERDRLITKFAKLEGVISTTNQLLSFFEAQRAQLYQR